jgi:hypothetical protein
LEANQKHLPHGAMRSALASILHNTPAVPTAPPLDPVRLGPLPTQPLGPAPPRGNGIATGYGVLVGVLLLVANLIDTKNSPKQPLVPEFKMPDYEQYKVDPAIFKQQRLEAEERLKQLREGEIPPEYQLDPEIRKLLQEARERKAREPLPVAPAPRPVEQKEAVPDEK